MAICSAAGMPTATIFFSTSRWIRRARSSSGYTAVVAHQHPDGQRGGHRLGDDGGVGHALHAHAEFQHEQQIQHRVHHGGHQQEVEGAAGIAHGAEDAGAHVVEQQSHDAGEVDGQIGRLVRSHLRGGLHQAEHQRRHGDAGGGEHHAHQQRQQHGGVDRLVDLFLPAGAVILADDHAGTAGQSQEKADERVDNRAPRCPRRKTPRC